MKTLVTGIMVTLLAGSPVLANAACFTEPEWRAAHVRILQTELQVAALECANVEGHSYNDQYSSFIQRFKDRLKANATALKSHFERVYGGGAGKELDSFVTRVANNASGRSMTDMKFCANSEPVFTAALAVDTKDFEQTAVDHVIDHSEIGEQCPAKIADKTVAAPKAAPKSTSAVDPSKVHS